MALPRRVAFSARRSPFKWAGDHERVDANRGGGGGCPYTCPPRLAVV